MDGRRYPVDVPSVDLDMNRILGIPLSGRHVNRLGFCQAELSEQAGITGDSLSDARDWRSGSAVAARDA